MFPRSRAILPAFWHWRPSVAVYNAGIGELDILEDVNVRATSSYAALRVSPVAMQRERCLGSGAHGCSGCNGYHTTV